jgi:hypothetical protein
MIIIYALICLPIQMRYVGSTKAKLSKRLREHRCLLRSGKHACDALQRDWLLHGEESFGIIALEKLPDDHAARRAAEVAWMQRFLEIGKLYNEHLISMRPSDEAIRLGVAASAAMPRVQTPEANERRRIAQLGIPKGHGAKISATKQARKLQKMR